MLSHARGCPLVKEGKGGQAVQEVACAWIGESIAFNASRKFLQTFFLLWNLGSQVKVPLSMLESADEHKMIAQWFDLSPAVDVDDD